MDKLTSTDLKYVNNPSPHLEADDQFELSSPFLVPVTASTCSHTFCEACISEAIRHSAQCPVDRCPLELPFLEPANPIIRSLVNDLIVECPYRDAGCPNSRIRRDDLNAHLEDECMHTPTKCPIPECGTTLPLAAMFEHQDRHRVELDMEVNDPSVENPFDGMNLNDSDNPSTANSGSSRPERILRLFRNWSVISARSRGSIRRASRTFAHISPAASSPDSSREIDLPLPLRPLDTPEFPFLVRAINAYESDELQELCFAAGDVLRITGFREDGWWEGDHSDVNSGIIFGGPYLIPSNFVEMYHQGTPSPRHSLHSNPAEDRGQIEAPLLGSRPPSSMYTDSFPSAYTYQLHNPETGTSLSRLSPHGSPEPTDPVLYYVRALRNHTASQADDFDFQAGDIMAVTDTTTGMRGYLLDDERRQDLNGRNRIPSDGVMLLY